MPDRPKLQSVADLAGVSIGTASRVINNKPNVLPETRARVLEAAVQLGYPTSAPTPEPVPHALSTIGVLATLIPDESALINPFYGGVLHGIDAECRQQNLKLMYAGFSTKDHVNPLRWPPMLHDPDVNGLILMGNMAEHIVDRVSEQTRKPIVLMDTYITPGKYDLVGIDNVKGAFEAVSYLIHQGHQHIGLLGSMPGGIRSFLLRREGYLQALSRYNIPEYIEDSSHLIDEVCRATVNLLQRAPEITAIFACLDLITQGVFQAAHDLGLRVPEDLSIMGFDDLELARSTHPPLTTMRIDRHLLGQLGVRQLIERAKKPDRVPLAVLLNPALVVRNSVAAPRK